MNYRKISLALALTLAIAACNAPSDEVSVPLDESPIGGCEATESDSVDESDICPEVNDDGQVESNSPVSDSET